MLEGLKILVPESRELDLFASMLEAEAAIVTRCPLLQMAPLDDTGPATAWLDRFIAEGFDDLILLTGEGLRHLLTLSGARRDPFIQALGRTRLIVRGPKPTQALREIGLSPTLSAPFPTSEGVLTALDRESLAGRRIGVQLFPQEGLHWIVPALESRGAIVFPCTPYRYASEAETAMVAEAIRDLAAGEFDMVAFTASPQLARLSAVAREAGLEGELEQGLKRTPIAAVGPVVLETLHRRGLDAAIHPTNSFHLKPLVRAIAAWRAKSPRL